MDGIYYYKFKGELILKKFGNKLTRLNEMKFNLYYFGSFLCVIKISVIKCNLRNLECCYFVNVILLKSSFKDKLAIHFKNYDSLLRLVLF